MGRAGARPFFLKSTPSAISFSRDDNLSHRSRIKLTILSVRGTSGERTEERGNPTGTPSPPLSIPMFL